MRRERNLPKSNIDLREIGSAVDYSIKEIKRETKTLKSIRDKIPENRFLDYRFSYKEAHYDERNWIKMSNYFRMGRGVRNLNYHQFPCFQNYINRKALLQYHGFSRQFISSRVPPKKLVSFSNERKKMEGHLQKMREFSKLEGVHHLIEIKKITKEEQNSLTKLLSKKKIPFRGRMSSRGRNSLLKLEIVLERTLFSEIFTDPTIEQIEKLFEERVKWRIIEESQIERDLEKEISLLKKRDRGFQKRLSIRVEILKELNFSRSFFSSRETLLSG